MYRSRSFRQGWGVESQLSQKSFVLFLLLSLFYTGVQWLISRKSIIFQGSRGAGSQHFPGVATFSRGVQLLSTMATYKTCDFSRRGMAWTSRPYPRVPPLDQHMLSVTGQLTSNKSVTKLSQNVMPSCLICIQTV